MGEAIVILSGKGGTGKTTVTAALATALAMDGARVLCIDCDVGLRNLDISLGCDQLANFSFWDVCQGDYELSQLPPHPMYPTLFFLTAPLNRSAEQIDALRFEQMVLDARSQFDYVLLDAPAGVDAGLRLAAAKADRALLVTGPDRAAIRDASRTGQVLELMGKENVRLIVNRIAPKLVSTMSLTVDDVMDYAGLPLIGIVPEDPNVVLAAAFGTPLLSYTKKGAAAAIRRIARRVQGLPTKIQI